MKEIVPCHGCRLCAIGYETGFTGAEKLHCSPRNGFVTREDGCTMGDPGEPGVLCNAAEAQLGGHV